MFHNSKTLGSYLVNVATRNRIAHPNLTDFANPRVRVKRVDRTSSRAASAPLIAARIYPATVRFDKRHICWTRLPASAQPSPRCAARVARRPPDRADCIQTAVCRPARLPGPLPARALRHHGADSLQPRGDRDSRQVPRLSRKRFD